MIVSFYCRETERIFSGIYSPRIPYDVQDRVRVKLRWLNCADSLDDLKSPPGNKLEPLKGRRKGQYSIRVNAQWRICFKWKDGQVSDVECVDYH